MPAKNKKTVAIIGFGLLGTSLGMALRGKKYVRIGWSRRSESRKQALKNNVVDKVFENPQDAVSNADITVICLPVPMIMEFCAKFAKSWKKGAIVTDVGSVKEKIVRDVSPALTRNGVHFIGSHPMAGSELSGAEAAESDLYEGAMVFLTPSPKTPGKVIKEISEMWKSSGARVLEIDSRKHDMTVAHTSHVPHIVAAVLTLTALGDGKTRAQRENGCAGGFRDTTRIASSTPQMWREIIENNREAVLGTLGEFEKNLKSFREDISKNEYSKLEKKFQSAKDLRDSWLSKKN
ncbi:MAG: prephenate dehydrogenase [Lentisphaerae bacterium]|nr:prephenate dehydrogenase [Lentisphaerota bacterium]